MHGVRCLNRLYFMTCGWQIGQEPKVGDTIYHESGARHAMQTNQQALLTVWRWTSHLDSEVAIVRG